MTTCYYDDPKTCEGELWQCQTCKEHYCQAHFHQTSLGENVECVACERERLEKEAAAEKASPRGWVFVDDDTEEEIGFAEPEEYRDADDAVDRFGRNWGGNDFSVFFRNSNGVLCGCACEDTPDDFD